MSENPTFASLATLDRWVVWRNELRGDPPKPTKVPYNPNRPGSMAMANNPATWAPRGKAEAALPDVVIGLGGGIGLELGDLGNGRAIGGIDLDTCRAPDGSLEPWAISVLERFGSYAEVSPSETGVKLLFWWDMADIDALRAAMAGRLGKAWKRANGTAHPPSIELYLAHRYFAITEVRVPSAPTTILPARTELLLELIQTVGPGFAETSSKSSIAKGRSEKAFARGAALRRQGGNYNQMVASLLADRDPNIAAWAREKGAVQGGREFRRIWDRVEVENDTRKPNGNDHGADAGQDAAEAPLDETELSLVAAFVDQHRDRLRFNHTSGKWHEWTGSRWAPDDKKAGLANAMRLCNHASVVLALSDSARARVRAVTTARHVTEGAAALTPIAASIDEFDVDTALLGSPGRTTNLQSNHDLYSYPPNPADMLSKQTAVAPSATPDCPKWEKFLLEACGGDQDLVRFLKQWCGYCLTGDTREHALLFIYGPGGNGKSVFVNTIAWIMGDYAKVAAMDTFIASNRDRHPTELAMLAGARLVTVTETGEGRTWDEARLKQMTGGDPISARFMRQDFFTYTPQFKLIVLGNAKPALRVVDDAARRRINVVNFLHKPPVPNKNLETELRAEAPSVLRWMVDGCFDWQTNGLLRPRVVIDATAEYFASQDTLARWIEDECETGNGANFKPFRESNAALWASWTRYAERLGEEPGTQRRFSDALERLGYLKVQNVAGLRGRGFTGLRVKFPANRSTGPASDDG